MRKLLRRLLPARAAVNDNRWLRPFRDSLLHPRLWNLNRRSAAGGVAVGLFCGLIPGPLQIAGSAVLSLIFKVNFPVAILSTFYTNPLTIVPLYFIAYELGKWVLGQDGDFAPPPTLGESTFTHWLAQLVDWGAQLGTPIAIGLPLLAAIVALIGYTVVRVGWRVYLISQIKARRLRSSTQH
jgi:uncharacterized protein